MKRFSTNSPVPGQLLIDATPLVLDLHRALYPIVHSALLLHDLNLAMRWSNDCKFLSAEVAKLCHRTGLASTERWLETAERLKVLGELCYEDAVVCLFTLFLFNQQVSLCGDARDNNKRLCRIHCLELEASMNHPTASDSALEKFPRGTVALVLKDVNKTNHIPIDKSL